MERFRLNTLMLLIVITALCVGIVVERDRAVRARAQLQARLALSWPLYVQQQKVAAEVQHLMRMMGKLKEADARQRK